MIFKKPTPVLIGLLSEETPEAVEAWARRAVESARDVKGLDARDRLMLEMFRAIAVLAKRGPERTADRQKMPK